MATLLIWSLIFAGIIYIYEGIIAPDLRLAKRFKLFALRDRLIWLKVTQPDEINDELFDCLYTSINRSLRSLPYFTLATILNGGFLRMKKQIEIDVPNYEKLLQECPIQEIREIAQENENYFFDGFMINSGVILIYLSPFLLIGGIIYPLVEKLSWVKEMVLSFKRWRPTFIKAAYTTIDNFLSSDGNKTGSSYF